jgi:hypothetical protein
MLAAYRQDFHPKNQTDGLFMVVTRNHKECEHLIKNALWVLFRATEGVLTALP